jgi:hypothetical protein
LAPTTLLPIFPWLLRAGFRVLPQSSLLPDSQRRGRCVEIALVLFHLMPFYREQEQLFGSDLALLGGHQPMWDTRWLWSKSLAIVQRSTSQGCAVGAVMCRRKPQPYHPVVVFFYLWSVAWREVFPGRNEGDEGEEFVPGHLGQSSCSMTRTGASLLKRSTF